jgi:hypothetical protein
VHCLHDIGAREQSHEALERFIEPGPHINGAKQHEADTLRQFKTARDKMEQNSMNVASASRGRFFRACVSLLAAAGILAGSAPSIALEPGNDTVPFATSVADIYGDMEVLVSISTSAAAQASITTSSDVDHILVVCSGTRRVSNVRLLFLSADIDLQVKSTDAARTLLGSSTAGGTANESVTVPATHHAVIARVFGFSGAISSYNIGITCS